MRRLVVTSLLASAVLSTCGATRLSAQLLGGGVGRALGQPLGSVTGPLLGGAQGDPITIVQAPLDRLQSIVSNASPSSLLVQRRDRLRQLVRQNRDTLDVDDDGQPVRRSALLGISLSSASLAAAQQAGFRVIGSERIEELGLEMTLFAVPTGERARKALARLQAADREGAYALDHVYQPAGATLAPVDGRLAAGGTAGAVIGLIDGGVGSHPAFAGAKIEQRGFGGAPKPTGHGTAIASLLVGSAGAFRGAATGASLLVADVYGGSAANGSATAIVRAMGWLAARGAKVINVSLVGSPNPLLAAAVKALTAKGVLVVAAVGNDGPAAPPQFPASYPGVVSVTGVDGKGRALIEAGRPTHLDFAAPGAEMVGALPGGGWEALRGTSFAAPLVTARLAARGSVAALASEAQPGRGKLGHGIVCGSCRTEPRSMGLK